MALVIGINSRETVLITTPSGDAIRIVLADCSKPSKIVFFAQDKLKIERIKKDFDMLNNPEKYKNNEKNV